MTTNQTPTERRLARLARRLGLGADVELAPLPSGEWEFQLIGHEPTLLRTRLFRTGAASAEELRRIAAVTTA